MFQYPEYQLFEETVYKDIAFGPINHGQDRGRSWTAVSGRPRPPGGHPGRPAGQVPFELSGGQKRRVALAGVMAMEPQVLVLDEPTAGLDPAGRENLMANIRDYHRNKKRTIILVSHSMDEIAQNVDRILVLKSAHVLMSGTPAEVFARAEELLSAGLDVPQVTRVAMRLREPGARHRPGGLHRGGPGAGAAGAEEGGSGMLKDITLGQFSPATPWPTAWTPGRRSCWWSFTSWPCSAPKACWPTAFWRRCWRCASASPGGVKSLVRGLKPVVFIIVFTGILNLFFTPGEHILAELGFLRISAEGCKNAVFMVLRIMLLDHGHVPDDLHHQPHQPHRRAGAAAGLDEKDPCAGP